MLETTKLGLLKYEIGYDKIPRKPNEIGGTIMNAIISVIGKDNRGIIYRVSQILYEYDVNILDISQTIMQNMFTMVMLVDISHSKIDFLDLVAKLDKLGEEIGMSIHTQHEDIFQSMHRI